MSKTKDLVIDQQNGIKLTQAEKRYSEARVYLHSHGIDIESRSDDFYRNAIKIAAGIKLENRRRNGY